MLTCIHLHRLRRLRGFKFQPPGLFLVAQSSYLRIQALKITQFSGFASGAGPVLADEGKQNPEAAEEMMVAEIRYDDAGG